MTNESPVVFLDPETGKPVKSIKVTTNKDYVTVKLLLQNNGKVKANNISVQPHGFVKLVSPDVLPDSLASGQKLTVIFELDTRTDREIPLDVQYSYLETVFI